MLQLETHWRRVWNDGMPDSAFFGKKGAFNSYFTTSNLTNKRSFTKIQVNDRLRMQRYGRELMVYGGIQHG